jgi:hypothetical protein
MADRATAFPTMAAEGTGMELADLGLVVRALHRDLPALEHRLRRVEEALRELRVGRGLPTEVEIIVAEEDARPLPA